MCVVYVLVVVSGVAFSVRVGAYDRGFVGALNSFCHYKWGGVSFSGVGPRWCDMSLGGRNL